MEGSDAMTGPAAEARSEGDALLAALAALANPHRLRIIGALAGGRDYVSRLARELRMSRPLLHMHLRKLEAAGLVRGTLELSEEEGKAMKYYEVEPFAFHLTPDTITRAARTLTDGPADADERDGQQSGNTKGGP